MNSHFSLQLRKHLPRNTLGIPDQHPSKNVCSILHLSQFAVLTGKCCSAALGNHKHPASKPIDCMLQVTLLHLPKPAQYSTKEQSRSVGPL